jgi:arginine-tRNA-protein transferase
MGKAALDFESANRCIYNEAIMRNKDTFYQFLFSLPHTPEHECAYYPGRRARLKAFLFEDRFPPDYVDVLVNHGFRRSGDFHYRTACPGCVSCLSYRVPVRSFRASRSQKRVSRRNADLKRTVISPPLPTEEKKALYLRYQYQQHFLRPAPGKEEEAFDRERNLETMAQQMYTGCGNSVEMEFRRQGELLGFAVFDVGRSTLSAVYSVYDPEKPRRSLGIYIILQVLKWARENGFHWVNLGYYLPGHPKMEYKRRFGPAEILDPATEAWQAADRFMEAWR